MKQRDKRNKKKKEKWRDNSDKYRESLQRDLIDGEINGRLQILVICLIYRDILELKP